MENNEKNKIANNFIFLNGQNDIQVKSQIGGRIDEYIKKLSDLQIAELKESVAALKDTTFENLIRGKTYPKMSVLVLLANLSGRPMCSFINDDYTDREIDEKYHALMEGIDEEQQGRILLRCWCEKNDVLFMYERDNIDMIFDENRKTSSSVVGFMLKLFRESNKITKRRMAKILGNEVHSVGNAERGNNMYSFVNTFNSAIYFDIPIDCFYIGQLERKDFVYKSIIYKMIQDVSEREEIFLYEYMKLYKENRV
ncbi:MAG: hypothetical protein II919_03705 [Lachnospiraceae bacterium]|nr:hypothetical protein [Lachnospiraceae bacterium]